MWTRFALALFASSCAVEVAPDSLNEAPPAGSGQEIRLPPDRPRGPEDPCIVGEVKIIDGYAVWTPVPCVRFEIDRGDPPPEARAPAVVSLPAPNEP